MEVKVKVKIRIIGWKTPQTRPDTSLGMTMPRKRCLGRSDVPKSATSVVVLNMDGPRPKAMEVAPADLDNFQIV